MTLSSVFSTLVWWEWAVYACGYLSCIGLAIWLYVMQKAEHSQSVSLALNSSSLTPMQEIPMPRLQRRGRQTVYIAMGTILVYILGIGSREAWLLSMSGKLENAKIVSEISSREFMMWTETEGNMHIVFCDQTPFRAGMTIIRMRYEDHLNCLSLKERSLSYFIDQGGNNGNAHAYTNTHANPYSVAYTNANR